MLLLPTLALAGPVDAVELSIGDHSVAPPFGNVLPRANLRPTVLAAVGHHWVDKPSFDLVPAVRGGVFVHEHAGSGWRLGPELAARLTAPFGPFLDANLGVGFAHTMHGKTLRPADGSYAPARDPGRVGATLGFGLGTGVDLSQLSDLPLAITVDYRWYALVGGWLPAVPLAPMADLTVGVRWFVGGAR